MGVSLCLTWCQKKRFCGYSKGRKLQEFATGLGKATSLSRAFCQPGNSFVLFGKGTPCQYVSHNTKQLLHQSTAGQILSCLFCCIGKWVISFCKVTEHQAANRANKSEKDFINIKPKRFHSGNILLLMVLFPERQ